MREAPEDAGGTDPPPGWELPGSATLYWPGGSSGVVFLLRRGLVALERLAASGDTLGLCLVRPGEVFGEEVLFGRPLGCFAETLVPSQVSPIPVRQMRERLLGCPREAWALAAQLEARSARLMDRIEVLAARSVSSRLAGVLLELGEALAASDGGPDGVRIPLTQARLASLAVCTRQTVNALLGRLEADGVIARARDGVRLLRPAALEGAVPGCNDNDVVTPDLGAGRRDRAAVGGAWEAPAREGIRILPRPVTSAPPGRRTS